MDRGHTGSTDVVVIGGGIAGASAAYHLSRHGARVTLVDRMDVGQATAAGAGILSPGSSYRLPPTLEPLMKAAVAFYPELLRHLAEDGETETGFETVGALFVATAEEEVERLDLVARRAEDMRTAGMPAIGRVTRLGPDQARRLFPALAPCPALYLPEAARVNGRLLCAALLRAAEKRGATVRRGSAHLMASGKNAVAVEVDGDPIHADAVILAAGAWTRELAEQVGASISVYPQRGQILHLSLPEVDTGRWPVVVGFHSHYLLTFPPHRVVAGATRETGSEYDPRVTIGGINEVTGEALRVAPGLAAAAFEEMRVGLRPATPDGLPLLGPLPAAPRVYLVTGHGPSGLQLGPYSGALVADLILGRPAPLDITPFAPDRTQSTMVVA